MTTFRCAKCHQDYAAHWRAGDGTSLCRGCAAERDGRCVFDTHPNHPEHPCSYGQEQPGEPCRYCGVPVPADGTPCPACWLTLESLPLADIKAIFAADGTFSIGGLRPELDP